jgi:hypothetical protein
LGGLLRIFAAPAIHLSGCGRRHQSLGIGMENDLIGEAIAPNDTTCRVQHDAMTNLIPFRVERSLNF